MLVVLDANTLASGATAQPGGILATLIDVWQDGRFDVAVSSPIMAELERTLTNPYFASRLDVAEIAAYLHLVRSTALDAPLTLLVRGVATHPEDDLVLATALSARAEYLVTGDVQLRKLGTHSAVTILDPREFLTMLEQAGSGEIE